MKAVELTEAEIAEIGAGLNAREKELKRERSRLSAMALLEGAQEIDDRLKVIKGDGPVRPGLRAKLGITEKEEDPDQIDHGDGDSPDYATWDMTVPAVREHVNGIMASDSAPFTKFRTLQALEAGEKEKAGGGRASALELIRSAIETAKTKVKPITGDEEAAEA